MLLLYILASYFYSFYRIRKLRISTAPTKAKLWEPAYSHSLNQNKMFIHVSRFKFQHTNAF